MPQTIRVAHSPDSDDAFMFYALAEGKLDTGDLRYVHELSDIESLNRRALAGELEVSAVSIHAYAYIADRYALLGSGASMGDGYGPRLVSRTPAPRRSASRPARTPGRRAGQAHDGLSRAQALPAGLRGGRGAVRSDRGRGPRGRGRRRPADPRGTAHLSPTTGSRSGPTSARGGSGRPDCRCRSAGTSFAAIWEPA